MGESLSTVRHCPAAHPDDRSECVGATDAVIVVDQAGHRVAGCVGHASAMLAAVAGSHVYPGAVPGAAVEAWRAAQERTAFDFMARHTAGTR